MHLKLWQLNQNSAKQSNKSIIINLKYIITLKLCNYKNVISHIVVYMEPQITFEWIKQELWS